MTEKVLSPVALTLVAGCDDGADLTANIAPVRVRLVKTVTDHDALLRFKYPVVVAASFVSLGKGPPHVVLTNHGKPESGPS